MLFCLLLLPITMVACSNLVDTTAVTRTEIIQGMELSSPYPKCRPTNETYFLSDPKSCPGYYLCDKGIASHGQCPFGFHFNADKQSCDKPSNVRCADPECPRRVGFLSWRNSCTQYHLCVQGIVVADLKCPNGSHFDEARGQCDFPENVQCGRDVCPQRTDPFDFNLQADAEDCSKYDI